MNLLLVQDLESWKKAPKEARSEFIECMRNFQFGSEKTRDAWEWFLFGWLAAHP